MELFTIGHSNLTIDAFIALLNRHGITAVADVRSHPYSRYLPHFNQSPLKASLLTAGIRYVFLGRELGARPDNLNCYVDGKALYHSIAATELFNRGIQRLLKGAENYKIALMCAEQDPITCHRTILVCQHLREFDLNIYHILKTGELESHESLEDRLLVLHKLKADERTPKQLSLLDLLDLPELQEQSPDTRPREELLKEAYNRQGDRIAYVEKTSDTHE